MKKVDSWRFTGDKGTFELDAPHRSSYLYFPLANESGMMSSITPLLSGDAKTSQNTFLNYPVSADDLHNLKSNRNFWVYVHGKGAWSVAGASSLQSAGGFSEETGESAKLEAGFLWHELARENKKLGIKAVTTSFVPMTDDKVELMRVKITNIGSEKVRVTPTAAIPIYGRSADNVRDHRHVTGLLSRTYTVAAGVEVQPAMTFDERGHKRNSLSYNVYGADEDGKLPIGMIPSMEEYIGEGGSLDWPEAVVCNLGSLTPAGVASEGYETVGALRFGDEELMPGASRTYILALSITEGRGGFDKGLKEYLSPAAFEAYLKKCRDFWEEKLDTIGFNSSDKKFDQWMKWVALQPILRRIYGCSFMPHHDYGKGGRGWRDLWQDCLALLLMDPETVRTQLLNNYGGIRLDGTNATIIGSKSGEFIADRNNISRVWSDHGAWPFFTTLLYINQSGDIDFLFEKQSYFKDRLIMRCRDTDPNWTPSYGNRQKDTKGEVYTGTILEHILLQNLTAFFNVGEHNNIRIENADWNDALDLAYDKGETVAFTAFYAGNLLEAAKLLREAKRKKGIRQVEISSEISVLLDSLNGNVDYDSVESKQITLRRYYETCRHEISGKKVSIEIDSLAGDLEKKACWLMEHVRRNEWIKSAEGFEWFNGYYDNAGRRVEGDNELGVRMTLTGQVFTLMTGIASEEQTGKVVKAADRYLFDKELKGYRLNTNFNEVKLDLGRCFGFGYGHKENGAIFSHMVVMFAAALYRRGFVSDGFKVLSSLYDLSTDFEKARIYPGIPEYFNGKGRGMYHYLTGSASWLLLVMLNDVYGIRGKLGDLLLQPKLKDVQFDSAGKASVTTVFAGRKLLVAYVNKERLDYGRYAIKSVTIDGKTAAYKKEEGAAVIDRAAITGLDAGGTHSIEVVLG